MADKYVISFAKVTIDKISGIEYHGIYFGGMTECPKQAEEIAKECVNNIKGGTIIPKVCPIKRQTKLIDAMYEAADKFETMVNKMKEAEAIVSNVRR